MKFHLLSDLHTGRCAYGPAKVCADALLLAGDIGDDGNLGAIEVARDYVAQGLPVYYVAGNHEFYGTRIADERIRLKAECAKAGVTVLDDEVVVINGVRIIGATLWTDFCLDGEGVVFRTKWAARQQIADFTWIFEGPNICLKPDTTVEWHKASLRFIEATLAVPFDGPTIVMTHHGCHPLATAERFRGNMVNGAFISNLSKTLRKGVTVWCHGHVHDDFDFEVYGARVIVNPRGYAKRILQADGTYLERRENESFDPEKVFEV